MENNLPVPNVPVTPPQQTSPVSVQSNNSKTLIVSLIALEVITLLVAGYFGYQLMQTKKQSVVTDPTPSSAPLVQTNIDINATDNPTVSLLPTGWTYKKDVCGVSFPIPPKEKPYYTPFDPNRQPSVTDEENSGRFWDFPRGGAYPNLLSKLYTSKIDLDSKQAITMYASEGEASGYISQAVSVSCIKNDQYKIVDNDEMLSLLRGEIEKYNQSTGEKGMQAQNYKIISNTSTTRWGKKVVDLVVSEDSTTVKYTMFVTPKYIYEVKVFGATTNSFIKETAQKIFDKLSFE